ncbi:hypothetical protein [Meridianimarinicoccus roseus]|uniref:hypothetical protein n=1 Tax=Meridianimarinicoccus roseus TaxID=2072018 RepID=UPI001EE66179|nr:hypothetical protein [Meridianimarinicoccus roseus]
MKNPTVAARMATTNADDAARLGADRVFLLRAVYIPAGGLADPDARLPRDA